MPAVAVAVGFIGPRRRGRGERLFEGVGKTVFAQVDARPTPLVTHLRYTTG